MKLYHGTSLKFAKNIMKEGIKIEKSTGGYFGYGFYTTPDKKLAISNYSNLSDDEGSVLEIEVKDLFIDKLQNERWELWKKISHQISKKDFRFTAIANNFHAVYDNSFEGVVIYNPKIISSIKQITSSVSTKK